MTKATDLFWFRSSLLTEGALLLAWWPYSIFVDPYSSCRHGKLGWKWTLRFVSGQSISDVAIDREAAMQSAVDYAERVGVDFSLAPKWDCGFFVWDGYAAGVRNVGGRWHWALERNLRRGSFKRTALLNAIDRRVDGRTYDSRDKYLVGSGCNEDELSARAATISELRSLMASLINKAKNELGYYVQAIQSEA